MRVVVQKGVRDVESKEEVLCSWRTSMHLR